MVESNVTLDAQTVLSAINSTNLLLSKQTVQIINTELVAGMFLEHFLEFVVKL